MLIRRRFTLRRNRDPRTDADRAALCGEHVRRRTQKICAEYEARRNFFYRRGRGRFTGISLSVNQARGGEISGAVVRPGNRLNGVTNRTLRTHCARGQEDGRRRGYRWRRPSEDIRGQLGNTIPGDRKYDRGRATFTGGWTFCTGRAGAQS